MVRSFGYQSGFFASVKMRFLFAMRFSFTIRFLFAMCFLFAIRARSQCVHTVLVSRSQCVHVVLVPCLQYVHAVLVSREPYFVDDTLMTVWRWTLYYTNHTETIPLLLFWASHSTWRSQTLFCWCFANAYCLPANSPLHKPHRNNSTIAGFCFSTQRTQTLFCTFSGLDVYPGLASTVSSSVWIWIAFLLFHLMD